MTESCSGLVHNQVVSVGRPELAKRTERLVDREALAWSVLSLLQSEVDIALSFLGAARTVLASGRTCQVHELTNTARAVYTIAVTYLADRDGNFEAERELQSGVANLLELICSIDKLTEQNLNSNL
jgi:hypothetical protein